MMRYTRFFLCFLLAAMLPAQAFAYIGPGLAVVGVWALLGPLAAVLVTVLLLAYFPARYYYKKHKNKGKEKEEEGSEKEADEEGDDKTS